jgi:hypothetical protein
MEQAHLNCEIQEVRSRYQFAMVVGLRLTDPSLDTEVELGPYTDFLNKNNVQHEFKIVNAEETESDVKRKETIFMEVEQLFETCMDHLLSHTEYEERPTYTLFPFSSFAIGLGIKASDVDVCAVLSKGIEAKKLEDSFGDLTKN